jgi:hypothetical protein
MVRSSTVASAVDARETNQGFGNRDIRKLAYVLRGNRLHDESRLPFGLQRIRQAVSKALDDDFVVSTGVRLRCVALVVVLREQRQCDKD